MTDLVPQLVGVLQDCLDRIEKSDSWWMDCPDRGGFDAEAIRAALTAAKAGGWQDISTAPKDGAPVILGYHMDEEYGGFVGQGRWHEADHDGPDNMGHDAGFMDDQFDFFKCGRSFGNPKYMSKGLQPTHWQPLPAPPAQRGEG